jgi:hypothetical protein
MFDNPSFYISIFSTVCLAASEILPFLPTKGNGILQAIIQCLSKYNKTEQQSQEEKKDIKELKEKIDILTYKLNTFIANKNNSVVV